MGLERQRLKKWVEDDGTPEEREIVHNFYRPCVVYLKSKKLS